MRASHRGVDEEQLNNKQTTPDEKKSNKQPLTKMKTLTRTSNRKDPQARCDANRHRDPT